MATQRRAAALLDGRHDLELAQAQVAALGALRQAGPWVRKMSATSRAGARHGPRYAGCIASSGLTTSRRISVATCV
jgi:hypothetical protein